MCWSWPVKWDTMPMSRLTNHNDIEVVIPTLSDEATLRYAPTLSDEATLTHAPTLSDEATLTHAPNTVWRGNAYVCSYTCKNTNNWYHRDKAIPCWPCSRVRCRSLRVNQPFVVKFKQMIALMVFVLCYLDAFSHFSVNSELKSYHILLLPTDNKQSIVMCTLYFYSSPSYMSVCLHFYVLRLHISITPFIWRVCTYYRSTSVKDTT